MAMRSYKESLKLARTTVRVPALTYHNVKLNIAMFYAFLWTLFGEECDYYKEVLKVLQVLESANIYTMRESYSTEVCRCIIWAILHEGLHFFHKKLLSTAFTLGRTVEYPMCLLNILDKVNNAEMIQRSTYPRRGSPMGTTSTGPSAWPASSPAACFVANTANTSSAGGNTTPKSSGTSKHGRRKTRMGTPRTGRRQPAPAYQGFDGSVPCQ